MRAQVFELCSDNFIDIKFIKPYQAAEACIDERIIRIYPVKSTITYITCLHEIGHIVSHSARSTSDNLASEVHAWKWAQKKAILWNATAKKHRDLCLKLYLKSEGKPNPNHIFWKIYKKEP